MVIKMKANMTNKQRMIRGQILNEIYVRGPISRVDIAKNTGITPATTTAVTADLIQNNLIKSTDIEVDNYAINTKKTSGRKKTLLTICNKYNYYVGIELARDFVTLCLTDNLGNIVDQNIIDITATQFLKKITPNFILEELNHFLKQHAAYDIQAVGIALPGHFDETSQQIASNSDWSGFDLEDLLSRISFPVFLENNVHCMSLYEHLLTSENHGENFIFFHAVKGIFSSSMYRGNLYGVSNFSVGEVGHTIIHPDGERCECGRRGCLQNYLGGMNIINKAKVIYRSAQSTYLTSLVADSNDITLDTVIEAYRLGDSGIVQIIKDAMRAVAITLNNLTMLVDTNKIYLHGPLFNNDITNVILKEYLSYQNLYGGLGEIDFQMKSYQPINGAKGACALAIHQHLIWSEV